MPAGKYRPPVGGDRHRTPCRFSLPADLVANLEAEAGARGIPVARLVDEIALALLPDLFAATVRDHIAESIRLAAEADAAEADAGPPAELARLARKADRAGQAG